VDAAFTCFSRPPLSDTERGETLPRIIILSACHTAREGQNLVPVARVLYDAGIKVVIGMNKSISREAAIDFNVAFFTSLCQKKTVKQAFNAGKEAVFTGEQRRIKANPNWKAVKEDDIPQWLARDENLGVESFEQILNAHDAPGLIKPLAAQNLFRQDIWISPFEVAYH
jgi:hypothetical protein